MFHGHPYLRQETRRVGQFEKGRVLRLIHEATARHGDRPVSEVLEILARSVRQDHQRLPR